MDTSKRIWVIKTPEGVEEGPLSEEAFQMRLRAGEIPLHFQIKSNFMNGYQPLLLVISTDSTFRRESSLPPPPPPLEKPDENN